MPKKIYDFSGIATAYEVLCDDGRVIRDNAFAHQEGERVSLVWQHMHGDITNILGHIDLSRNEGSPLGVRGKAKFLKTREGQQAKELVHDGTIEGLSIWANEIQEEVGRFELDDGTFATKSVIGGVIREVSLVPRGMNPGARIDEVIRHSTDPLDPDTLVHDGLIIHSGLPLDLEVEDEEETEEAEVVEESEETEVVEESEETEEVEVVEETEEAEVVEETEEEIVEEDAEEETESDEDRAIAHAVTEADENLADVLATLTGEQREAVDVVLHSALIGETPPESASEDGEDGQDLGAVFDTLTDKQRHVVEYLAGALAEVGEEEEEPEEPEESISQGDQEMPRKYNPFESSAGDRDMIAHENVTKLLVQAKKNSHPSLRTLFEDNDYGDDVIRHSVTDIDFMFPDARAVKPGGPMLWANREMGWVRGVLDSVRPRMFGRIKSWYADISADEARAKGWTSPNQKVEEVLAILKRVTTPQTIYKFQKLDRDDVIDITDFNVVVWLKAEMRLMLDEELARAVLIGDGRTGVDDDKIVETNVRPIYNDSDVYTHKAQHNDAGSLFDWADATDAQVLSFVDHISFAMSYYQGSGSPTLYCQPSLVSKMLQVRDTTNRRIHDNLSTLAAAMRVSKIVEVPVISGLEDTGVVDPTGLDQNGAAIPAGTYDIATLGIIVNLQDYVVGADKGGETSFFEDFDLNFNKLEYLIETRISGALTSPKSAIAVQLVTAKTA